MIIMQLIIITPHPSHPFNQCFRPTVSRSVLLSNIFADNIEMESDDRDSDKAILLRSEVEELCEGCRAKVENIVKEEGKQRLQGLQTVVSPLDGFSIIGNQLSSIPGVSSIKKIGSGIPYNVQHLAKLTRNKNNHPS